MATAALPIGTKYFTTDGREFDTRGAANKHQLRLNAISDFADDLSQMFGLERIVAVNTATYLADRPEKLMGLIGKTLRKKADEAPDAGDDTPAAE